MMMCTCTELEATKSKGLFWYVICSKLVSTSGERVRLDKHGKGCCVPQEWKNQQLE